MIKELIGVYIYIKKKRKKREEKKSHEYILFPPIIPLIRRKKYDEYG